MANITLALQDDLLKKSRKYAADNKKSLNSLIREMLEKSINKKNAQEGIKRLLEHSKKIKGNSGGKKFNRDDLYREF